MEQGQVSSPSTVVWGRGPALAALAASLTRANVGIREIWHQDSLASLPEAARRELKSVACGVPLIADMNSMLRVLERLEGLPEVNTVAEVFYTKVISPAVLERVKIVNIHPAPLPRYRGAHPLPWQIIRGESESAVSFHVMVPEIDAGPIIKQVPFSIEESDDYGTVFNKVLDIIRSHAGTVFNEFALGRLAPVPQDHTLATFVVKRAPHDGWISWSSCARDVRNFVRALTAPLPGAWSLWNGQKVIFDAVEVDERFSKYVGRTPGQVARLCGVGGILTGDSAIVPHRVRDADTGRDVTQELRINDRFTSP
jgi:methionyl-tRNA formyltransferase